MKSGGRETTVELDPVSGRALYASPMLIAEVSDKTSAGMLCIVHLVAATQFQLAVSLRGLVSIPRFVLSQISTVLE